MGCKIDEFSTCDEVFGHGSAWVRVVREVFMFFGIKFIAFTSNYVEYGKNDGRVKVGCFFV